MSLPDTIIIAIADAVERQGGDIDDVQDLIEAWQRVHADSAPRVDAMQRENRERQESA